MKNNIPTNLRFRHHEVWRAIEGVDPREQSNKLATYQAWFASPFNERFRSAARVPRYLYLDLSKHVVRNISRFRLRAHTLRVETGLWQNRVFLVIVVTVRILTMRSMFYFTARMPVLVLLGRSMLFFLKAYLLLYKLLQTSSNLF